MQGESDMPPAASPIVTVARFLAAGAANTVLTIVLYQALLFVMNVTMSYVIAYAVGVAFAAYAYARHVFDTTVTQRSFGRFAVFYVASGFVGTLVNGGLVDPVGVPARIAVFVTVAIMLPLNYFGSRAALGTRRRGAAS